MLRRPFLKLSLGFLGAILAAALSLEVVLADSMTLSPTHGQPSDPITATYIYVDPTGAACPVNQLSISFWWDTPNYPISSALVHYDANRNCVATLKFVPTSVKGAPTGVGRHVVLAGPSGTLGTSAPYTIDPPPQPTVVCFASVTRLATAHSAVCTSSRL